MIPSRPPPQAPSSFPSSHPKRPASLVIPNADNSGIAEEKKTDNVPSTAKSDKGEQPDTPVSPTKLRLRSVRKASFDLGEEDDNKVGKNGDSDGNGGDFSDEYDSDGSLGSYSTSSSLEMARIKLIDSTPVRASSTSSPDSPSGNETHTSFLADISSREKSRRIIKTLSSTQQDSLRRNSHIAAIDKLGLSDQYAKAKPKTARERWLTAIRTVLRGVRTVNAFMPQAQKKKVDFTPQSETAANKVKKTAVRQAIRSRMAIGLGAGVGGVEGEEEASSEGRKVGFKFGKAADSALFDNCVNILKLESKRRRRPDIVMLVSLFEGNEFFAKLDYDVKLELAAVMGLDSYSAEEVVFKQGDKGDYFYIVLSGVAEVYVDHMGIKFKACTYKVGGSFGERALLTSERRAATVVCITDCNFLVISKRDYIRVLRDVHEREFSQKLQFLKTVRYFEYLPHKIFKQIASKTTKKRFGRNQVICREGEKKTHLYIIRHGECRVLKMVTFPGKQETVHMETRKLSSRDFFGEDGGIYNTTSVVSLSFAECYCIHFNDLKNMEDSNVQAIVDNLRSFGLQFSEYIKENALAEMYEKQRKWDKEKKAIMDDAYVRHNII